MGMTIEEEKKVKILREKVRKYENFDRDAWVIVGTLAFCKEADEFGGTLHILDEMIKMVDKYSTLEEFMGEVGTLVGLD